VGFVSLVLDATPSIPHCDECEAAWLPVDEERWSAYLTDDDDEVVFYCPDCAEREFCLDPHARVGPADNVEEAGGAE
jgi:hypothetical protein